MVTAELQTANVAYLQRKNPIIRYFCISGWLGAPVNPDKRSSTVLFTKWLEEAVCPISNTIVKINVN